MARFKRRKAKVVWLPVQGRDFSSGVEGTSYGNGVGGVLEIPNDGTIATQFQDVTFDYSDSASAQEGVFDKTLHDLTSGSNYRLRRLVGKFHAGVLPDFEASENGVQSCDVAAGFIINRTDPDGNPLVSASIGSADQTQFGPLSEDAAEDPWIWRRRYFLSACYPMQSYGSGSPGVDAKTIANVFGDQPQYPQTTAGYGSVADGPHIDQKTARVIGPQERLFFWVQGRSLRSDAPVCFMPYQVDLRILASLRFQQGNRRNASR